jgi:hypothetical protein
VDVLKKLSYWLLVAYDADIRLSGLIYLHPINKARMTGHAAKNLRMFQMLCGKDSLSSVVLVTTMWSKIAEQVGRARENELKTKKEFWGDMIGHGSAVFQHDDTTESAMRIVTYLVEQGRPTVLSLPKQIREEGRRLEETAAGQALHDEKQNLIAKYQPERDAAEAELREARTQGDVQQLNLAEQKLHRAESRIAQHQAEMAKLEALHEEITREAKEAYEEQAKDLERERQRAERIAKEKEEMLNAWQQDRSQQKQYDELAREKLRWESYAQMLAQHQQMREQRIASSSDLGEVAAAHAGLAIGQVAATGIIVGILGAAACIVM